MQASIEMADQVMQFKGRYRASAAVSEAAKTGKLVEFAGDTVLVTRGGDVQQAGGTVAPIRDHTGKMMRKAPSRTRVLRRKAF